MRNPLYHRMTSAAHIDFFDLMEMNNVSSNVSHQGPSKTNKIKRSTMRSKYTGNSRIHYTGMQKFKRQKLKRVEFYPINCQQIRLFYINKSLYWVVSKTSLPCFAFLYLGLRFLLGKPNKIISYPVNVTPPTTTLTLLFSSVKKNKLYSETNITNLNSGSSILSTVKGSILLTGTTYRGK